MGSLSSSELEHIPTSTSLIMGNVAVRNRIKKDDLDYLAKNTRLMSRDVVDMYFDKHIGAVSRGRIESEGFKEIFHLAFPSRPEDKLDLLIKELEDEEQSIAADRCCACCTCSPTAKPWTTS